jgi:glycosyltransferase involved in cell wall biosynthesis
MVHDLDFLLHPERSQREIRRDYPALAPAHIRAADAVAVNSRHTAAEVVRLTGVAPEQIFVCPLGRPDWAPRDHEPADAPLLFLGSLEPRKNVGLLLDAYERLLALRRSRGVPTPKLALAGGAGLESDAILQRARGPALAPHVDVLGYVDPDARRDVYASAMMCIMPSHTEGFGLPALEAMTAGVPVVAADQGALPRCRHDERRNQGGRARHGRRARSSRDVDLCAASARARPRRRGARGRVVRAAIARPADYG